MKVDVVKGIVLVTLFFMTCILGIIPVFLRKLLRKKADCPMHRLRYKRVLSFLSCYAAGVFLATGVLDLLPSSRTDLITSLNREEIFTPFPVAEFVMMIGLFIILIVEQIVLTVQEKHSSAEVSEVTPLLRDRANTMTSSGTFENSIGGISDEPARYKPRPREAERHCDDCDESVVPERSETKESDLNPEHEHSALRSVLLLVALSLHSVFEGLAVGLQESAAEVLGVFAALVMHKSILSFSLGMNLIQSKLSQWSVIRSIIFFSLTSPVGVAIGIGIIDLWDSESSSLIQGMLTSIACGTFLYVTFFEVLPSEFNDSDVRLIKVLCLLLGFSTVTGILFLDNDDGPTCYVLPK